MVEACKKARSLIQEAVTLLDQVGAPADIAANLDLALSRLDAILPDSGDQIGKVTDIASR